ncbi:MAG: alanine racemase [Deltaproteobacteria bacterium]|nr:alanine racemase [Deltaproteobacteria bacterium]MBW2122593.1 alanine racemase [Deltaproteobacteria bacterium]
MIRPTRAIVNLGAVAHNTRILKERIGSRVRLMAVVKADGYGHGAVPVAKAALTSGAEWLGVALVEEGIRLRQAGLTAPILVLGGIVPGAAERVLRHELTVSVFTPEVALAIDHAAAASGRKGVIHVKVDTGMGRLGLNPRDVPEFVLEMKRLKHIFIEGVFSHFASAEEADKSFSRKQLLRLINLRKDLEGRGIKIPLYHMANSAGTIELPESHLDMVRPGISLYGLYPSREVDHSLNLVPAMELTTRIVFLRELAEGTSVSYGRTFVTRRKSRIAVLPVGYGDGYPRLLSNRAEVLVCGRRAPVVGRICMDMTMVDVTDVPEAAAGREVVLFGRQRTERISVEEIAEKAGTINYEITCGITKRVPRHYRRARKPLPELFPRTG